MVKRRSGWARPGEERGEMEEKGKINGSRVNLVGLEINTGPTPRFHIHKCTTTWGSMVFIVFTVCCGTWALQRQTWLNTRHRARNLMEPVHGIVASVHWEMLSHFLSVSFCQVLSGDELFNTLHLSLLYPWAGCRIAALLNKPGSVAFALAAWFCTGYCDILRKTLVHSSSRKSLAWIVNCSTCCHKRETDL